ncbi:MAG TPA: hypothetical protein VFP70_06495 [Burkholderiales bacterium]|nr:hypothetical protein [Burkholderiales bacterium]
MTLRKFLTLRSIVAAGYGVLFVLIPGTMLPLYGAEPSVTAIFLGRLLGSALLTFAAVLWLARDAGDSPARRAIVLGFYIGLATGFVVSLHGQLTGVANALGWTTVAVYALFGGGYGYFHFSSK